MDFDAAHRRGAGLLRIAGLPVAAGAATVLLLGIRALMGTIVISTERS